MAMLVCRRAYNNYSAENDSRGLKSRGPLFQRIVPSTICTIFFRGHGFPFRWSNISESWGSSDQIIDSKVMPRWHGFPARYPGLPNNGRKQNELKGMTGIGINTKTNPKVLLSELLAE